MGRNERLWCKPPPFTSAPIAKTLRDAHKRDGAVTIILDKSQRTEQDSSTDFLAHAGIPTYIDA